MKIAVSGKGGVGKTTISAYIVKKFAAEGYQVYAVDADPDLSLGTVLGIENQDIQNLKPIVDMRDVIAEKSGGGGAYYSLNPDVDDVLNEYAIRIGNIKFFKMGAVKQGGSSCYCRENSFLNSLMNALLLNNKDVVVLDMGAGIEHLTRGTSKGVDAIIVVTEPTLVSVQTAQVVTKLAHELEIKNVKYIGNKIRRVEEQEFLKKHLIPEDILGFISYNESMLDEALGLAPKEDAGVFEQDMNFVFKNLVSQIN
ncbi:P-loop NTPase [Dehalobacterium formicoaceticum]|uniref:P-loop NTPase n=1 Tax=Dehalobacterium formicoaceticum TaxID=51515 RepID=A0ABT1Y8E9_9FIRM|nr:P-loop NTPase [Dehalobacterium formicoaceticum]MCR6546355.1 P-loop NTPase [Dehalobacterium formicoaceticum]